jgi:hypothetical protein
VLSDDREVSHEGTKGGSKNLEQEKNKQRRKNNRND